MYPILELRQNPHNVAGRYLSAGRWGSVFLVFVPACCLDCTSLDPGEPGEYGEKLTDPYCERNVWMPVRTGKCKKQTPYRR